MRIRYDGKLRGLTLIELMVVLLLLSLTTTGAIVLLQGPLNRANLGFCIAEVELMDNRLRRLARRGEAVELRIDGDQGTVSIVQLQSQSTEKRLAIHPPLQIRRVLAQGLAIDGRKATIAIDKLGATATYAIEFQTHQNVSEWIVFLGLSGQCMKGIRNETDVYRMLDSQAGNHFN